MESPCQETILARQNAKIYHSLLIKDLNSDTFQNFKPRTNLHLNVSPLVYNKINHSSTTYIIEYKPMVHLSSKQCLTRILSPNAQFW